MADCGGSYGGGRRIKSKLEAAGLSAVFVRFGKTFSRHTDGSFELNPAGVEGYQELFRELEQRAASSPIHIVHLGSLIREDGKEQASSEEQNFGFFSLFHMAQAIGELRTPIPVKIGIISNRLHSVTGEEDVAPAMATVLGPCGVIPKEYPNVKCFSIDLPDNRSIESLSDEVLARIICEFAEERVSRVIAYRGNYRWERKVEQVRLNEAAPSSAGSEAPASRRLKPGGVYLITGGTGGIGLAVAGHLARACRPRLVLTKKSPFPKKSSWNQSLTAPDTPASVRKTITALMEIEKMGAEIDIQVAEVCDRKQMQRVVDQVLAKYGTIDGVIHAAGVVKPGVIQGKTREAAESVLAPKVNGTAILFDLLREIKPDFLVLFSSINSILTPYALCDYSAANSFLDAYSGFANARGGFHTLTINWPGWRESGQLADLATPHGMEGWKQEALEKAITTKDGVEAFRRALNSSLSQVIVCPENLELLLQESEAEFDATKYISQMQPEKRAPRPPEKQQRETSQLSNTTVQAALTEIWRSVFGLEDIGVHEHFADLAGHSLIAMQIISRIRSLYQIPFTFRDFFEGSTIAQISSVVQARMLEKRNVFPMNWLAA